MALMLASLRDAVVRGIRFRWYRFSTTGYRLSCLRHEVSSV